MTNEELIAVAERVFALGYTRVDTETPGVLRYNSVDDEGHAPKQVPIEVWWFIRGTNFGVGNYTREFDSEITALSKRVAELEADIQEYVDAQPPV